MKIPKPFKAKKDTWGDVRSGQEARGLDWIIQAIEDGKLNAAIPTAIDTTKGWPNEADAVIPDA